MPQIVLAATQAAALTPAVAPAVIAPAATGLGAAAANTAAIELAKQKAIEAGTQQLGQQVAQQATQQVGQQAAQQATQQATQQLGQQAANQGIAQASQQATQQLGQQALTQTGQEAAVEAAKQTGVEGMKQGIFSANPAGMPPTAGPIAPTGPLNPAQPLPPAGGTPFTPPTMANTPPVNPNSMEYLKQQYPEAFKAAAQNAPQTGGAAQALTNTAPDKLISQSVADAQAASKQIADVGTSFYDKPVVPEGIGIKPPVPATNPLLEGAKAGLEFAKAKPLETGLLTMGIGQYMNEPEEEDKDKYKNTVDMSEFQPSIPTQRPFTRSYEYQSYQAGGPVEDMSRMNSLGANTGFPMARLQTPAYAVSSATPMPVNTLTPTADASVNAYTGEPRFAEGGLSAADRREYGLKTRGQRAAQNLTKTFEEMEEERQKEAMKLFGERFDPGIIRRSRTQELSSPFSAAMAEHARLGKKAKVPVVEMPKTNLGDIDTYMDIPIDAANGGIMRSFSNGGPSFMGTSGSSSTQERQGPKFMGASQSPTQAEIVSTGGPAFMRQSGSGRVAAPAAPVMSAPQYNAPAQQAFYSPISYQDGSSYQMPAQQSDMSDFYNYMNQQLANYGDYGYAAGGGIMGGSHLGGYSDGGRLLRGPGDGVSDSIPAVIGKRQPARLADGEFVIPARIVSELGNGSTEAGARKLYAMMERVQATRKKSIGKKKVAVNSKADKHLPA